MVNNASSAFEWYPRSFLSDANPALTASAFRRTLRRPLAYACLAHAFNAFGVSQGTPTGVSSCPKQISPVTLAAKMPFPG